MVGLKPELRKRFRSNGFGDWGGVAWAWRWLRRSGREGGFGGFKLFAIGKILFLTYFVVEFYIGGLIGIDMS